LGRPQRAALVPGGSNVLLGFQLDDGFVRPIPDHC
jgi:hypothetical protein